MLASQGIKIRPKFSGKGLHTKLAKHRRYLKNVPMKDVLKQTAE